MIITARNKSVIYKFEWNVCLEWNTVRKYYSWWFSKFYCGFHGL